MRNNLLWLFALVALAALAVRFAPSGRTQPGGAPFVPSHDDIAAAQAILHPASHPSTEPERRLQFYNQVRDMMDARRYGVLEALNSESYPVATRRESTGIEHLTFFSAIGGDRDFQGGGDEDWPRLVAFATDWMQAIPTSAAARLARAQARILSDPQPLAAALAGTQPVPPLPATVVDAISDIEEAATLQGLHYDVQRFAETACKLACACHDREAARRAFRLLDDKSGEYGWGGQRSEWIRWAQEGTPPPAIREPLQLGWFDCLQKKVPGRSAR